HQKRHETSAVPLEEIGGVIEQCGARLAATPVPILAGNLRGPKRLVDGLGTRGAADANHNAPVMRRGDPTNLASFLDLSARNDWIGSRGVGKRAVHLGKQWLAHQVVPEREAETVLTLRPGAG